MRVAGFGAVSRGEGRKTDSAAPGGESFPAHFGSVYLLNKEGKNQHCAFRAADCFTS